MHDGKHNNVMKKFKKKMKRTHAFFFHITNERLKQQTYSKNNLNSVLKLNGKNEEIITLAFHYFF